ncbi:hypothetical protein HDE_09340 [Halotydeus destructor]|nr:hypothetical protein HDE_09340 [Halotydeus destructor]
MSAKLVLLTTLLYWTSFVSSVLHCDSGWFKVRDKCLIVDRFRETFAEAERICRVHYGGDLVMIKDADTNKHIVSLLKHRAIERHHSEYLWIGAKSVNSSLAKNQLYYWIDGSPVKFNAFQVGNTSKAKPADDDEEEDDDDEEVRMCAAMQLIKHRHKNIEQWAEVYCEARFPFICEKSPKKKAQVSHRLPDDILVIAVNPVIVTISVLLAGMLIHLVRMGYVEHMCKSSFWV